MRRILNWSAPHGREIVRLSNMHGKVTYRVNVTSVIIAILSLLYGASLVFVYREYVVPQFSYMDARYYGVSSTLCLILGSILIMAGAFILPQTADQPSKIAVWILFIMLFIPAQIFPVVTSRVDWATIATVQLLMFFGLAMLVILPRLIVFRIPSIIYSEYQFEFILMIISLILYAIIFRRYGFSFSLPNLGNAYDIRAMYMESNLESSSSIAAYAISWQGRVINPLIMVIGIVRFRPTILFAGLIGQLAIYSTTGLRSVLFSVLIIAGVALITSISRRKALLMMSSGAIAFVWICYAMYILIDFEMPLSTFVRRMLVVPGTLLGHYLDFFQANPFSQLSDSILASVFERVYERSYTYEVGAMFLPDTGVNMNAGLWPDGYAQFGYIGIIVFSFIAGLYFLGIECASRGKDSRIVLPMSALCGWTLVNSSLFTSLMTHGLLLIFILFLIMPSYAGESQSTSKLPQ